MSDLESQLRAEVARRTDEFSPSADLPDQIHKRVSKRRRQRKLQAIAASAAVVALAVPALLLVRPAGESETEVTGPDEFPDPMTTESSTTTSTGGEDTSTTSTPRTTDPEEESEPPDPAPEPRPTPTETGRPGTTTETTTTGPEPPDLKPPDSDTPAAGTCAAAAGPVVEMRINPDVPDPRCMQVTPGQRLQVRNNTDEQVTVSLAHFSATLGPGQSQQFDQPFGDYLQPGVHNVSGSPYPGGSIWLGS